MDRLQESGHRKIVSVLICGGLSRNPLFVQIQADAINLPVLIPFETESVLLGSAILAAFAAGAFPNMRAAIESMAGEAKLVHPCNDYLDTYYNRKYIVFLRMMSDQKMYEKIMAKGMFFSSRFLHQ